MNVPADADAPTPAADRCGRSLTRSGELSAGAPAAWTSRWEGRGDAEQCPGALRLRWCRSSRGAEPERRAGRAGCSSCGRRRDRVGGRTLLCGPASGSFLFGPTGADIEAIRATVSSEPSGLFEHLLVRLQGLPVLFLALFVIVLLRRIVRSVIAGDPFVPENVRRLRAIGWLIAVSPILLVIAQIARSELVARSTVADLAVVSMTIAVLPVLIGALLLVLAQVFAAGVRLRQDTDGLV